MEDSGWYAKDGLPQDFPPEMVIRMMLSEMRNIANSTDGVVKLLEMKSDGSATNQSITDSILEILPNHSSHIRHIVKQAEVYLSSRDTE